jgi:hypothetical protein
VAIFTRFGSPIVKVSWFDEETGDICVDAETTGGAKRTRCYHISELKADGGLKEIVDAAEMIRNPQPK